jgi:gluconokinase
MMVILLMGVAGSGKTTIGKILALHKGWAFHDADDFHSEAAKNKMERGEPLTDDDRTPWLEKMRVEIEFWLNAEESVVLGCSALKGRYRQVLHCDDPRVKLVYLKGSYSLLEKRLRDRPDHFMKAEMLKSQFDALEEPSPLEAIQVDIDVNPDIIVQQISNRLG